MAITAFLLPVLYLFILFFVCFLSTRSVAFFIPDLDSYLHPSNKWIDGLRGIAATMVVMNHASLTLLQLNGCGAIQKMTSVGIFLGSIGVQIFFCITGMLFVKKVISRQNINWIDFYRKRIRRIVPAYCVLCFIACLVALIYSWPITEPLGTIIGAIPSIFSFGFMPLPHINNMDFGFLLGVNWTLAMEWRFYFLLPIIVIFFEKWPKIFVPLVLFALGDLLLGHNSSWVYFISGAASAPLMSRQFSKSQQQWSLVVLLLSMGMYVFFWDQLPNYGLGRWVLMSVLFVAITIARPAILTRKPLMYLGLISYSFYLLHGTILFTVFHVPARYGYNIIPSHKHPLLIAMAVTLVISVIFSCISYLYVERRFMFPNEKMKQAERNGDMILMN